jgi:para-nitrobenzyl esterase
VLRKLLVALVVVVVALLAGVAIFARNLISAKPPVPAEPPRTADLVSQRTLPGGGDVVGYTGRYGSHVWLGIPYAEPPVGERRWRAPAPPAAWNGTRDALAFGHACSQLRSIFGGVDDGGEGSLAGDEDCLTLNVYAPQMDAHAAAQSRLPVLVWIHGGGNVVGLAGRYDGGRLAQTERVIVVTVNYRLGPLGWLRHASLREGVSAAEQSGNFGLLDLVRALEWVRDNAAAFGGDPGNVTVFGESAGGRNVVTLLLSPLARGLFQRAIVQSGGTGTLAPAAAENFRDDPVPGHESSSNEVLVRLLVAAGEAADAAAARQALASLPAQRVAAFLRGRTPEQLFAAYTLDPDESLPDVPQVFADGVVLPEGDALGHFARPDGWNRVPVIAGTNLDENLLFMFMDRRYVRRWLGVLPQVREPDLYLASGEARSALWKFTGADAPIAAMWRTQPNVYAYRFDWDEEPTLLGLDVSTYVGAAHGFEIPFVFGHWDLGRLGNVIFDAANEAGREALSAQMMSYWASFAWTGDPGRGRRGELPAWTAWDDRAGAPKYMILDTPDGGGLRMGSEAVTVESVLAQVESDPRLATQRERCFVYHELAAWGRGFEREQYESAGRGGCAEFPYEEFPWK